MSVAARVAWFQLLVMGGNGTGVVVVPVDFACVDTATLYTSEAVATLGTSYALANGSTCEGAATMGVPYSRARLYSPRSIAYQRPC